MTLSELLPALHGLLRSDKLCVIQVLASDVAREEGDTAAIAGSSAEFVGKIGKKDKEEAD